MTDSIWMGSWEGPQDLRTREDFALKNLIEIDFFLHALSHTRMIFPLCRSFRGIVTSARVSGLISISSQGANKASLAGRTLGPAALFSPFKCQQTRTMSRDVAGQSDIRLMSRTAGGSFERAPSSFRSFIEKGGKFSPERGTSACLFFGFGFSTFNTPS